MTGSAGLVSATDTKAVLLADALMFLVALVLGVLKYRQMLTSEEGTAHLYMDTAHRAALLYSFALLLIASFVQLSGFSEIVNLLAAGAMALYFFMSVINYTLHGLLGDTDNLIRDRVPGLKPYMVLLICAEIGGWLVLVAGFLDQQVF